MSLAALIQDAMQRPCEPPEVRGRGVVTVAGGAYLPAVYIALRHLRDRGCGLPVQVWHLGAGEIPDFWAALAAPLDVVTIDALRAPGAADFPRLGGWECKIHALTACPFERVLLLDADNIPLVDPTFVLDSEPFLRRGQVFWPDFLYRPGHRYAIRSRAWRELGLPSRTGLELESGQLAVDRTVCFRELQVARLLNVHSSLVYDRLTWGDKDTFTLAWLLTGRPYTTVPLRPRYIEPDASSVFWQHWFDGTRLFQHQRKWLDWREITVERLGREECFQEESMRYLRDWRAAASGTAGILRRSSQSNTDPSVAESPEQLRARALSAFRRGRGDEAIDAMTRAVRNNPSDAGDRLTLADLLIRSDRAAEAVPHLMAALRLGGDPAAVHCGLGEALARQGRFAESAAAWRNAVRIRPELRRARYGLGESLRKSGDPVDAIAVFEEILRAAPGSARAWDGILAAANDLGDLELALKSLRALIELRPGDAALRSSLLYTLHYHPDMDAASLFREHLEWDRRFGGSNDDRAATESRRPQPVTRSNRLRIGYLSPDFREHTVPRFIGAALRHHDRDRFEIFCYSDVERYDAVTRRLRDQVERWRDIVGLPDEQAERIIRDDGIDILVDLRGHAASNRMTLLARKPAPLQINMVGYFDTTGLSAMDSRLTDSLQDPPGKSERFHTERLLRIEPTCWCYTPDEDAPEVAPLPSRTNGRITFGSLNKIIKISEPCARLWAATLEAVPGSRLLLAAGSAAAGRVLNERLKRAGIPNERLHIVERTRTRREYLSRFGEIDIALDTFPFNGITTSCDGLWMGVPFVSLAGGTSVSRAGRSILHGADLPHLAADTPERFVAAAVELAGDPIALERLRAGMRERLLASPLMDHVGFTRALESCYWNLGAERNPSAIGS